MLHEVEHELIKITGFDAEKTYKDRQDYLAALVLATAALSDDEFETLSDDAKDWCNDAAYARKSRKVIRDFTVESVAVGLPVNTGNGIDDTEGDQLAVEAEERPSGEAVPSRKKPKPQRLGKTNLTGEVDKYGIAIGTKSHLVVQLLEQGRTMKDIKEAVGDSFYNLVNRLQKEGHTVVKEGHMITLRHKDDVGK